ncbi:hypothetical protein BH20ACT2_BH20ACT2_16320 [soil metagenome]
MNLSPAALVERTRSDLGAKAIRYSAVSVIGVVITQILLIIFHGFLDWPATSANIAAVCLASAPAYLLNRYWVWGKRGRNHLTKEVLPFWGFALTGLVFSTLLVAQAEHWWDSALAVSGANIAGFGILWVLKFFVLDSLMFGVHHHPVDAEPARVEVAAKS